MNSKASSRLTQDKWLQAGFEALAEYGAQALKAEPLARRLGTTKGSFYWHFADVPAFHKALLGQWEETAISRIVTGLATEYPPTGRLRRMGQVIADKGAGGAIEPAIRAWAKGDAAAAKAVARVDAMRLNYLMELLSETGIDNPEMARIIYAASIGMEDLGAGDTQENARSMGSLVDLILAVR
jgi:AcrR family transcriptional regulator